MGKNIEQGTSEVGGTGYGTIDEAVQEWKDENKPLCRDRELGAFIYIKADAAIGKKIYILGRTDKGMRNNIMLGFAAGYICGAFARKVKMAGFIHTHPDPGAGRHNDFPSKTDLFLLKLPGISEVYIVPWERCPGIPEIIKTSDRRSWEH